MLSGRKRFVGDDEDASMLDEQPVKKVCVYEGDSQIDKFH